jgi:surfeit locus 1 family protein
VWQNLRREDYAAWSGLAVQPVIVEQTNDLGDGLLRDWERPEATFVKNEMYALQWYSLAALCVILFIVLSFRREIPS